MKFFSRLSPSRRFVTLTGLGVALATTSSATAFAAPEAAKPVLVAQAATAAPANGAIQAATPVMQASDQSSSASGSGSATAAPSDGTTTTAPALSVGTGASPSSPPKDAPQAAAEEPKAAPKPRPWAGSQIFTQISTSTDTILRGQQQDWNPTVDTALYLQPRYLISKDFQLRGRMVVNYELTDSDTTVYKNEPQLSDTTLQLFYRGLPTIAGAKPLLAANLGVPTSKASRYRTLVVSPGATLQVARPFEHVLGGDMMIISQLTYSHPIYRSTTPELPRPLPYAVNCMGGQCDTNAQLFSSMNASDALSYMFILVGEWGKWSPAAVYAGGAQWAYQPAKVDYLGQRVTAPAGFDAEKTRQTHYFSFWLDYNANSWLTAEVGYWMSRTALDADGKYGNPFFNRYNDMRMYLGANFNIDNIMQQLEGGSAEGGVVRAQNKRTSVYRF